MSPVHKEPKSHPSRLLPVMAAAFAELGYRKATTAALAARCKVRENVLYRAWPSKKAMFIAALDYVSDLSLATWHDLLARPAKGAKLSAAQRVLEYEAAHHGEFGLYRIVFAGLAETDDPDIREAMQRLYGRFHGFIVDQLRADRSDPPADMELVAWAMVGLGTVSNISRELELMSDRSRQALFRRIGSLLIEAD